jgi:hypothetical protein
VSYVALELAEVAQVTPPRDRNPTAPTVTPPQILQSAKEEKDAVLQRNRSAALFSTQPLPPALRSSHT